MTDEPVFDEKEQGIRDATGRFRAGKSGNPRGRPLGARDRATVAAQALLDGEAESLTRKVIELALGGDLVALRLCLERLVPSRREHPIFVELPSLQTPADGAAAMAALTESVSTGWITPGEANAVAALIQTHVKLIEATELESRVKAIERQIGGER